MGGIACLLHLACCQLSLLLLKTKDASQSWLLSRAARHMLTNNTLFESVTFFLTPASTREYHQQVLCT
jgi:hypothetical protein